jgi:hypothetical protein
LTIYLLILKSIGSSIIYQGLFYCSVWSLKSIKQKALKILSGRYLPMSSFDPWPFDRKINSGHLLFMVNQCTKFKVCQAKDSQDIEWSVYSYVQFDNWHFDLNINKGHLQFNLSVYEVWNLSSKRLSRYWVVGIFLCPVWPLTLWPKN